MSETHVDLTKLRAVICDVDGVLTNGQIQLGHYGEGQRTEWFRFFSIYDGMGIKLLQREGFVVGVITTSDAEDIRQRMASLEIEDFHEKCLNKVPAFQEILSKHKLEAQEVCYIGDDWNDVPILETVGFSATVPHALESIRQKCDYVTARPGGHGAVREVADMILRAQGKSPV